VRALPDPQAADTTGVNETATADGQPEDRLPAVAGLNVSGTYKAHWTPIMKHTVEKIGGTSMSRFGEVMRNVIIADRRGPDLYSRIFVVSAYAGITNALLEDKKTGAPGVYAHYAAGRDLWLTRLEEVRAMMKACNRKLADLELDLDQADAFVDERLDGIRSCLEDLMRVRSYGHMRPGDYLPASRELLSAVGESHSAFNSTLILQRHGVHARFVDLALWKETELLPLDDVIRRAFVDIDLARELPIVTGYVKCDVGLMTNFDRGYSEYTFSKICVLTGAREGIIHKEYHLCTGDPVLIGADRVEVIGNTNFDIADQMSDMNMEAIHARASKEMQLQNIPLRVKNAFEPQHPGTLISRDYVSPKPKVEMICGREDVLAVEVFDPEMVGKAGYDYHLLSALAEGSISYLAKSTNANTITHYIPERASGLAACLEQIKAQFPDARTTARPVAVISILGTNLPFPAVLAQAFQALAAAGIDVLGLNQATRRVSIQLIVDRDRSDAAQLALHEQLVQRRAS
jgi:aspartate kinase